MWSVIVRRQWLLQRGATLSARIRLLHHVYASHRHKWMISGETTEEVAPNPQGTTLESQDPKEKMLETIIELKHYLRTRELQQEARLSLLREKLADLIQIPPDQDASKDYFGTINAVFMHFFLKNNQIDYLLSKTAIYELFNKTARFYLDSGRTDFPMYMNILGRQLLQSEDPLPVDVLVNLVDIGSRVRYGALSHSLTYVLRNFPQDIDPDFTVSLLEREATKTGLCLDTFEDILSVKQVKNYRHLVNDGFVKSYVAHIQQIFADSNPKVHEYLDANRNFYRVQYLTNLTISQYLKDARVDLILQLLKLKIDLNSVAASEDDKDAINTIIMHLQAHEEHSGYAEVKRCLLLQNIDDEGLADALLTQISYSLDSYKGFLDEICAFIVADDIKFSSSLRLRAELLTLPLENLNSDEAFAKLQGVYEGFLADSETPASVFSDALKAIATLKYKHSQELMDKVSRDMLERTGEELTINDYKVMIDRAIDNGEKDLAYTLFEESLTTSSVHWNDVVDPSILSTLDRLVTSTIKGMDPITEAFSQFKKIKQNMPISCSADALHELTKKMLAEACVGDVIELMKRELPKIDKDAYSKIRLDLPYCAAYRNLFSLLLEFIITYKNDTTFETNWVLYGELHKYFHIPYDSYLPVIEFFCDADRLNAALIVVRRMKFLSELHAEPNINTPPLREIYVYLLKVFGDKLYEEGVVEIHEYLKMDTGIETQDINLQNCILNAYSNLQNVGKARDLFLTISSNPKQHGGINEETAQIMIKTYTYSGLPYVKSFWNNLSQFGIFPDYAVFKQYLIAHTYHGSVKEAVELVEEIDDYNLEFSSDLLLSMHNYCVDPEKQKEIVQWAIDNHLEEWEKLKESGLLKSATPYMPDNNLIASGAEE